MRDLIPRRDLVVLLAEQQRLKEPLVNLKGLADLCIEFGRFLGLSYDDLAVLEAGAYLHDIGHVLIEDSIIRYPGRLNAGQWAVVKGHVEIGKKLLSETSNFGAVLSIVEYHHERLNGSGYPKGLIGSQIPYLVQVFAICDTWHSILSDRPWRKSKTVSQALDELQTEVALGMHDNLLVKAFFASIENKLKENKLNTLSAEVEEYNQQC